VIADHLNEVQFLLNLFYIGANFVRAILCIRGGASSSLRLRRKLVHLGASSSEKIRKLCFSGGALKIRKLVYFLRACWSSAFGENKQAHKLASSQALLL
jgi:hypothetical protein